MADSLLLGLRVALSLAVVLAVLWFVARQLNGRTAATRRVPITVVGRQNLSRRAGMAVVEVGGRTLVLGVSDAGVQLLTELDDDPAAADDAGRAAGLDSDHDGTPASAPAAVRELTTTGTFADVLAAESPTANRRRRRAQPVAHGSASPLAGSVLDKHTWSAAFATLRQPRSGTR